MARGNIQSLSGWRVTEYNLYRCCGSCGLLTGPFAPLAQRALSSEGSLWKCMERTKVGRVWGLDLRPKSKMKGSIPLPKELRQPLSFLLPDSHTLPDLSPQRRDSALAPPPGKGTASLILFFRSFLLPHAGWPPDSRDNLGARAGAPQFTILTAEGAPDFGEGIVPGQPLPSCRSPSGFLGAGRQAGKGSAFDSESQED